MAYTPAPGALVDDEGEAFARAVFYRFLRQATICRDIDDVVEHMHIVNDDSRTFDIRLGGEARVPVSRELILALASKKKELMALCESTLRTPKIRASLGGPASAASSVSSSAGGSGYPLRPPAAVVFPPPTALAATQSVGGPTSSPVGSGGSGSGGSGSGGGGSGGGAVFSEVGSDAVGAVRNEETPLAGRVAAVVTVAAAVTREAEEVKRAPFMVPAEELPIRGKTAAAAAPAAPAMNPGIFAPPAGQLAAHSRAATLAAAPGGTSGMSAPKTVFVRKLDQRVDREDFVEHFSSFGEIVAISMNPSRGYAFVDYASHDCVLRAVSATDHTVGHKLLVVEVKKELSINAPPRYPRR